MAWTRPRPRSAPNRGCCNRANRRGPRMVQGRHGRGQFCAPQRPPPASCRPNIPPSTRWFIGSKRQCDGNRVSVSTGGQTHLAGRFPVNIHGLRHPRTEREVDSAVVGQDLRMGSVGVDVIGREVARTVCQSPSATSGFCVIASRRDGQYRRGTCLTLNRQR